jgi:hypothetical protein
VAILLLSGTHVQVRVGCGMSENRGNVGG